MARAPSERPDGLAYLILAILFYMVAFSLPTRWDSEYFAVNSSENYFFISKIVQAFSVPLCIFVVVKYPQNMFRLISSAWTWAILVGWCLLSTLWSVEPKTTFLAAALITIILIFCGYVALQFSERNLSQAVAIYMIFLCVLSIAMGILLPQYGLMNSSKFSGLLRGPYSHKNLLGDVVSLLMLWTMCAYFARSIQTPLALAAMAIGAITVIWTWSTTSVLMLVIVIGPLVMLRSALAFRMSAALLTVCIVAFVIVVMAIEPLVIDQVFAYFGKDPTLSGRDVIWQAYLDLAGQRPLTGFGYGAIQNSKDYGISIRFTNGGRPSAHNSFITTYVDLGLPALIFYVVANIMLIFSGIRRVGRGDYTGLFSAVFPIGYAINCLMEATGCINLSFGLVALLYLTMRRNSPVQIRLIRDQYPADINWDVDAPTPSGNLALTAHANPAVSGWHRITVSTVQRASRLNARLSTAFRYGSVPGWR